MQNNALGRIGSGRCVANHVTTERFKLFIVESDAEVLKISDFLCIHHIVTFLYFVCIPGI